MVAHTHNPRTWEAEFEASLGHTVSPDQPEMHIERDHVTTNTNILAIMSHFLNTCTPKYVLA